MNMYDNKVTTIDNFHLIIKIELNKTGLYEMISDINEVRSTYYH